MIAHRRVCATSGASLPPDKAIEKAGSISAARRAASRGRNFLWRFNSRTMGETSA